MSVNAVNPPTFSPLAGFYPDFSLKHVHCCVFRDVDLMCSSRLKKLERA